MNDALEMAFFGCYQRETLTQVKAHLVAEYTSCTGAGAVAFINAGI